MKACPLGSRASLWPRASPGRAFCAATSTEAVERMVLAHLRLLAGRTGTRLEAWLTEEVGLHGAAAGRIASTLASAAQGPPDAFDFDRKKGDTVMLRDASPEVWADVDVVGIHGAAPLSDL